MRITGGALRGREIKAPKGVRPTQDKIRAAVFSSLGERILGANVLDLYAGSGALGLEAWSRGAARVCWVEKDRQTFRVLKGNVAQLCFPEGGATEPALADVHAFLGRGAASAPFDVVLADPPYAGRGETGLLEKTLRDLEGSSMLAAGALLVFEQGAREPPLVREGWNLVRDKTYGDTRVLIYVRAR
ncbi:MAG: 16S rRNA (guanine(966)-N(2))-methyltransferase RsmD [Kiritimatiellae bacterium]|nr:16S rRNA (guanine(966)-N(2))-methyltransferase RsmD [Kiritimatiellia bacterium]